VTLHLTIILFKKNNNLYFTISGRKRRKK